MKSDQRVALITGAARRIGLATARKFLAENHRVALLDIDAETLSRAMKLMDPDSILKAGSADRNIFTIPKLLDQTTSLIRVEPFNNAGCHDDLVVEKNVRHSIPTPCQITDVRTRFVHLRKRQNVPSR